MEHWYPKRRFGDLADDIARRFAAREGLVFEDDRFTFGEIAAEVDRAAKALMSLGVRRGDHVSLWLNNCADWIFIMYAAAKVGAVLVPINTRFRTHDLQYVLAQSDSSLLITHDVCGPIDYLSMVREVVSLPQHGNDGNDVVDGQFPDLRRVVILGRTQESYVGTSSWAQAQALGQQITDRALAERAMSVDPDDPVLLMYTSGTTGFPKGVVHTHKLVRNNEERVFRMGITENDVVLNYLPLFHAFGLSEGALNCILSGAKQVVTEIFDPNECLEIVARERVSVMHGFEAHMKGLTEAQESKPRNISSLRTGLFAAGMHSATPVCRRGGKILAPLKAISGFGMTEVWLGASICSVDDDEEHRFETSGYPGLGYELRVVDPETGHEQPPGEQGELQIRGYSLMLGYYKKPKETAESFAEDGWFKTGDTAVWREDGYIRFLGRYKDMLKVGGENVDPMEIEGLLLEHPDVFQVAVVGYPDVRLAEVAVAFVQRVGAGPGEAGSGSNRGADSRDGEGPDLDADKVIEYCRGKVASFKIPRHVFFVDEFPMTASGKIRKVDLREWAKAELGDSAPQRN